MTSSNGNERGALSLLILVLLGDEAGNASVDEEGEKELVVNRCVGGGTMLLGKGHPAWDCRGPIPSTSLWTPAAAGAPGLLLLLMVLAPLFSISMSGATVCSDADEG